jgi:hypothetical protein
MIQIRHGVFETNSSSSHSISIKKEGHTYTKEEIMKGLWLDRDGSYYIWDNDIEFGRSPFEPLITFKDKIRFALASYHDDQDKIDEISDIFTDYTEGGWLDLDSVLVDENEEDHCWYGVIKGYIDHQSIGLLQNFLRSHNISLEEFLTNSKYVVWIDGDEYCIKEKLFESGLIHAEDFEDVDAGMTNDDLEWEQYKKDNPDWDKPITTDEE